MQCPYCRHPLEPLVIQGRHTGVFQCVRCGGAWLQQQQFAGLLGAGGPASGPSSRSIGAGSMDPHHSEFALSNPFPSASSQHPYAQRSSPWEPLGAGPSTRSAGGGRASSAPNTKKSWWRRAPTQAAPPENPDWDLCTYCGQLHPGGGPNCAHCNVERMHCPICGGFMVGIRRQVVLLDLCIGCQGAFFEKGRLEQLLERMRGVEEGAATGELAGSASPSLLQQLATFFEDTEPSPYSVGNRESTGLFDVLGSAIGEGLGGSRRVIYDLLVMLGDVKAPGTKRAGKPDKPDRR